MPAADHRQVRVPFPDAGPGTCRYCGQPCSPGLRSHRSCRTRHADLRDYREATLRDNGERCAQCGTTRGPFHADHVIPLIDGGSKAAHNRQVLCEDDHKAKTAREARERAARRRGETLPDQEPTGIPWRLPAGAAVTAYAAGWLFGHRGLGAAGVGLVALTYACALLGLRQRAARERAYVILRDAVGAATGTSVTAPRLLWIRRWRGGQPVHFEVNYGMTFDDGDEAERLKVERAVARKSGRDDLVTTWAPHLNRATFRAGEGGGVAEPAAMVPADGKREAFAARIDEAVRGFIRTGDPKVTVGDWDAIGPESLAITYPATFRDDSAETRAGLQAVVNAKAPVGRWRLDWDTANDRVVAVRRPVMPASIPHLPPADLDNWRLPFATGEDGEVVCWDLKRAPHCLVAGGTGAGKTVALRALITEACLRGFEVRICDPKRIEMAGLRGWPGVREVATGIEDMIDLVERMADRMDSRYDDIEAGRVTEDDLQPTLFVLDEAREFIDRANAYWKANKEKGQTGTVHPAVERWRSIARLGRSGRVHLVTGIQRPDAAVFGGEARDNYGARVALGELSAQGAQMMFDDASVGRDLPEAAKGRATVDLKGGVSEVQVWWTPDPRSVSTDDDRAILDALTPRRAA